MDSSEARIQRYRILKWRAIGAGAVLLLCLACGLAMEIPLLDPTSGTGSWFGFVCAKVWLFGLLILLLRVVRSHHSRFRLRTLMLIITCAGILFGLGRVPGSLTFTFVASCGMVWDSWLGPVGSDSQETSRRRRFLTVIEAMAGVWGLAHTSRVAIYLFAIQIGLLSAK
jgi:hypothetical protein